MNEIQLLKAYGQLPNRLATDLQSVVITQKTRDELATRSCGCPDAADREIAETDDVPRLATLLGTSVEECRALIDAHRRMLLTDAGDYNNNRWGKCNTAQYPNNASLTYFLDLDTFPAHYKRAVTREELESIVEAKVFRWPLEQLLDECLGKPMVEIAYDWFIAESYRVLGCQHIRVTDGPNGKHNVHVYSTRLGGSVIGRAWFPDGSCGDHVNHQIDSSYKPGLIGMCKLGCHEFGHNHGEPHQFAGQGAHHSVMSYDPPRLFYGFSTGKAPHTLPRDKSIDSLSDKYGGVPVPLKEQGPTPGPGPTPEVDLPKTLTRPNGMFALNGKLHKFWIEEV